MSWKNLMRMQDDRPSGNSRGFHLSLHTEAVPTDANELDPLTNSGYDRLNGRSDPLNNTRNSSQTASEWKMFLAGQTTSVGYWGAGFVNQGGTSWDAALSAAINYGPSAEIPRASRSYRIAEITLPAPWILRVGATGLPPGELVSFSVARPTTVAAGGFYRSGDQTQPLSSGGVAPSIVQFYNRVVSQLYWGPSLLTDNDVPAARRAAAQGRTLDVMPWYLEFWTTMDPPSGQQFPTAAERVPGLDPVDVYMRPNHDYSVLENVEEVGLSATQAITAPVTGFWALRCGQSNSSWSSGVVRKSSQSDYLIAYGSLDAMSPSLARGEGVIEPGQLRVEFT